MARLLAARTPSAARSNSSETTSSNPETDLVNRRKRTLIESACQQCRRRKSRCNGQRPCCGKCQARGTECIFEAEAGESRWSVLRRRNQHLEEERAQVRELFDNLQKRPDLEAQELFTRIRAGGYDEALDTVRQLRVNRRQSAQQVPYLPPLAQDPDATLEHQRLPSIQSMFAVANRLPPTMDVNTIAGLGSTNLPPAFSGTSREPVALAFATHPMSATVRP